MATLDPIDLFKSTDMTKPDAEIQKILGSGMIALGIALGVSRFAYTPLLPLMQRDLILPDDFAGYLASVNYLGYLAGALWAAYSPEKFRNGSRLPTHLLINLAATAGMGLVSGRGIWMILRLVSGFSSAMIFVVASRIVLQTLACHDRQSWSGWLYAGVGIGIVITALTVPILDRYFGWQGGWLGLTAICSILVWAPMIWLRGRRPDRETAQAPRISSHEHRSFLPWLLAAYFLEGLGYIVTGTFLVALLHRLPGLEASAAVAWLLVGAAAIPSCVLWMRIGLRIGLVRGLIAAHLVQTVGILLPVIQPNLVGALAGAVFFGGTFVGIATLNIFLGQAIAPGRAEWAIGLLTAAFGAGQIIGPSVAGVLAVAFDSLFPALTGSAATVFAGALCLWVGLTFTRRFP